MVFEVVLYNIGRHFYQKTTGDGLGVLLDVWLGTKQ